MSKVSLDVEDFSWNRISYDDEDEEDEKMAGDPGQKLHNHAFIHKAECVRTCSVTLDRKGFLEGNFPFTLSTQIFLYFSLDMSPKVVSGIKNLRLVKTDQATFVGFHRDAYRTLPELHTRVLRFAFKVPVKKALD